MPNIVMTSSGPPLSLNETSFPLSPVKREKLEATPLTYCSIFDT